MRVQTNRIGSRRWSEHDAVSKLRSTGRIGRVRHECTEWQRRAVGHARCRVLVREAVTERSAKLAGEFLGPVHTVKVDGRWTLRLSKDRHWVDIGRQSRSDQAVGRDRGHGEIGLDKFDQFGFLLSVVIAAHGSKAAKDFRLDTADLLHLVGPRVRGALLATNTASFAPFIQLFEQIVALLAELF